MAFHDFPGYICVLMTETQFNSFTWTVGTSTVRHNSRVSYTIYRRTLFDMTA